MLHIADRSRTQRSRTSWFLLLSLLLHGLAMVALNVTVLWKDDAEPTPKNPIRVSFVRPEKVEEPQQADVFAEASSRAQSPEGAKAEVAKDTKSILPKPIQTPSEPSAPSRRQPPLQAQPAPRPRPPVDRPPAREEAKPPSVPPVKQPAAQPRRQERVNAETSPPRPRPKPSTEPERVAKLPEPVERPVPTPESRAMPRSQPSVESPSEQGQSQQRLLGRIPLLSGDDLEKYAQVRASDQRSSSGETVSLDTKELKYLSYFAHIKRRIEGVWTYPPEAIAEGVQGQLHLKFVLRRNGQVKTVELLRSSGSKALDKEAWDAVVNAGPFNPFPPRIPEDELHITARFTYVLDEAVRRTRVR